MRAVLFANATATTRLGRRRRSPITQGSALVAFERSRLALAPLISSRRKYWLPRLDMPPNRFCRKRILGLGHGADGRSHLCSVADIMLGAFRYCVNEPDNERPSDRKASGDWSSDAALSVIRDLPGPEPHKVVAICFSFDVGCS
jgi:hypothetical protein